MKKQLAFLIICLLPSFIFSQDFLIKNKSALFYSGTGEGLRSVWFSPDNSIVYGDFQNIYAWNVQTQQLLVNQPVGGYVTFPSTVNSINSVWVQGRNAYVSPDKPDIINMYSVITVTDLTTGIIANHHTDGFDVWHTDFIEGTSKVVAIVSLAKVYTNAVIVYDLEKKSIERTITSAKSMDDVMSAIKISPDSKYIAVSYVGQNKRIEIYDFETGKILKTIKTKYEITSMDMNNERLVFGGANTVNSINLEKLTTEQIFKTTANVGYMALSPNGKTIVVAGSKGCDLLDIETKQVNHFSESTANSVAFSPNGKMIAIGIYVTFSTPEITSLEIWFDED